MDYKARSLLILINEEICQVQPEIFYILSAREIAIPRSCGDDGTHHTADDLPDARFPPRGADLAMKILARNDVDGGFGPRCRSFHVLLLEDDLTGRIVDDSIDRLPLDLVEGINPVLRKRASDTHTFRNKSFTYAIEKRVLKGATGYRNPQCSACFINSVEDTMSSIMDLAKTEAMLFKWGSGSGSNLSAIRGSMEHLSGGGIASGPISFMRGFDSFAGVVKSGGKTRRAAKMVILNADHPDIEEFIVCKGKEEAKAKVLIAAGYDGSGPDSEAYSSISFQNANNSVRVTDEFMQAAVEGEEWDLTSRKDHKTVKTVKAMDLLRKIAEETWSCGDPGMQFDTTVNRWHTSKASGSINSSNPCSEYMFLDDSACNLASLNLVKFLRADGSFNVEDFKAAVRLLIIAQDILVDLAGYPTELIAENSHDFRPLGLGYANLGTLLLELGVPYDSERGRDYAAAVTALMGGMAYKTSAEMAGSMPEIPAAGWHSPNERGAFPGFAANENSFREVMRAHHCAAIALDDRCNSEISIAAEAVWHEVVGDSPSGFRNAQVTVLAPTGTIGFMMDCDTTGIEPMLALVANKKLVGGGFMTLVNKAVPRALTRLGYEQEAVEKISAYVIENGTIEGAPGVRDSDLPVFDTAFTPHKGARSIGWRGHLGMMAAVQPFLSGAISKTVNLPNSATVGDIAEAYIESWRLGLKAVAIYRDGSKAAQPMSTKQDSEKNEDERPAVDAAKPASQPDFNAPPVATRHRLPNERASVTHKFNIGWYEGYITVGLYPNGSPGEIFMRMSKEGSTISGLMDSWAAQVSLSLQNGTTLKEVTDKMVHTRFEPSGWTGTEEFGFASSLMDYIGRWLQNRFGDGQQLGLFNNHVRQIVGATALAVAPACVPPVKAEEEKFVTDLLAPANAGSGTVNYGDAPVCSNCGGHMRPSGKCHTCLTCGTTSGGCS